MKIVKGTKNSKTVIVFAKQDLVESEIPKGSSLLDLIFITLLMMSFCLIFISAFN